MRSRFLRIGSPIRWMALAVSAATLGLIATVAASPMAQAHANHPSHALHASYVSSNPAANAVVKTAPSTVTITFAEPLDPTGSDVVVYDAKGQVVSQTAQVEQSDLKTMQVPIKGNGSEVYLVSWRTVSATDGDPDIGAFNFFVNASGTSDLAPTSNATSTTPTATSATSSTGAPIWLVALIGVIALVVGLVGGRIWGAAGARETSASETERTPTR